MSQSIRLVDAAGNPAAHSTTIWTARAVDVGRFFGALGIAVGRQNAANGQAFFVAQCTGFTMAIVPAAGPSDPNATPLFFAVDSLQATLGAALATHGRLVMQPYQTPIGYQALVADPDGRRITLTEMRGAADLSAFELPALIDVGRSNSGRSLGTSSYSSGATRTIDAREAQALASVQRGAMVVLVTLIVQLVLAGIGISLLITLAFSGGRLKASEEMSLLRNLNIVSIAVNLLFLGQIGGKVLCGMPASSRAGYGTLWIAVGLESAGTGLTFLAQLFPDPSLQAISKVVGFVGIASPIFFIYFLGSFMKQIRNEPVAQFAKITNIAYGIVLASALSAFGAAMARQGAFGAILWTGLTIIGYVVCFIILLAKVMNAKPNIGVR